jgi:biopolymer transport protein ExbD
MKKFDTINVVPFIDIMLVLLVIVLTTATFVAKGIIPLELAKASSSEDFTLKKEIVISIKKQGEIFFNDKSMQKADLKFALLQEDKKSAVYVNCDKDAKFELFVSIMDTLKEQGFENLGIITKK